MSEPMHLACAMNPDDNLVVFPSAVEGKKLLVVLANRHHDAESIYLDRDDVVRLQNYLALYLAGLK